MGDLRIVFMGTPEFAVPSLQALAARRHTCSMQVVCVVTQPDRPAGRGGQTQESAVKRAARALEIPVWQPERLRRAEHVATLRASAPDLIVVAAFAQILSPAVLAIPRFGCLNVHASLLPRYRGASPISAAILAGDSAAGVTMMQMEAGLDTGPLLAAESIPIAPDETTGALTARLAVLGADLLARTVPRWVQGEFVPTPQDETRATLTRPLAKDDGLIEWTQPAALIERATRAYHPWPGVYTYWDDRLLKIRAARTHPGAATPGLVLDEARTRAAVSAPRGPLPLLVGTGDGLLEIVTLQPEGRRAMAAIDFLAGHRHLRGLSLGAAPASVALAQE